MYQRNPLVNILGYVTSPSDEQPKDMEAVIANAVTEHLRVHANDGMSLFVFVATCAIDPKRYVYPISARDRELAFQIATTLHASRGLPPAEVWILFFEYPDPGDRYLFL